MDKNKKIIFTILGLIVLVAVFYAGMFYGKKSNNASLGNRFPNMQSSGSGQFFRANGNGNRMQGAGGFLNGEIISKDNKSLTIRLNSDPNSIGSGSKIVFFDANTVVSKMVNGSIDDLKENTPVIISGASNTDGSITAKSIQIRTANPKQ